MCLHRGHWSLFAEGAKAADDVLQDVFGLRSPELRESQKDGRSFLTRAGFEAVLRDITRELILIAKPHDQRSLQRCLQALDTNWRGLSPEARDQAIDRAAAALGGVPQVVLGPVVQALSRMGQQVVTGVKQAHSYDMPINAAFDVVDQRVVDHAANSQALFVRNEYGKREVAASQRAREIVSAGLESGLDRYDIGKRLAPAMSLLSVNRAPSYWENVASIHGARSRTWGSLSAFTEAGITEYEIVETMDEVTCSACRLMHHRTFSTASAASRYQQVAESDDPEAVADFQPFLGTARNRDTGEEAVYFRRGGQRRAVAQVVESGFGVSDKPGKYANVMGRGGMEAAGVSAPPFHGRCRGTLVASEKGLTQVPVQVSSAPVQGMPVEHVQAEPPAVVRVPKPRPEPKPDLLPIKPSAALRFEDYQYQDDAGQWVTGKRPVYRGNEYGVERGLDALYGSGDSKVVDFKATVLDMGPRPMEVKPHPYAEDMKALGKLKELIDKYGEGRRLSGTSEWEDVIATKAKVDRATVASYIVKSPDGDRPVIVRYKGKDYLHHGHELIMADTLRRLDFAEREVVLIDLEKARKAARPDPKKWASDLLVNLPADAGTMTADQQKAVRDLGREWLKSYGVETREDRYHRSGTFGRADRPSGMNQYATLPASDPAMVNASAYHGWRGEVVMRDEAHDELRAGLRALGAGDARAHVQAFGVRVLLHEAAHGCSRAQPPAYYGVGVGMEEAATEIIARRATRDMLGKKQGDYVFDLPRQAPGGYAGGQGSYQEYIRRLFDSVAKHTGHDKIQERIEGAVFATRQWDNGRRYATPQQAVDDFVEALDVKDARARAALRAELLDATAGPFRQP